MILSETENKTEQPKLVFYKVPENLLQAVINCIANSIITSMTTLQASNLINALQKVEKIKE